MKFTVILGLNWLDGAANDFFKRKVVPLIGIIMNASQCPSGENAPIEGHPISDLDGTGLPAFVVRDGATFLLCALNAQGQRSFPHTDGAQRVEVGPEGVLYSFSTVHVSSSQPVPYTIGYVDFPGDVRVLAKVRGPDHALRCDGAVRLASAGSEWFVEPVAGVCL